MNAKATRTSKSSDRGGHALSREGRGATGSSTLSTLYEVHFAPLGRATPFAAQGVPPVRMTRRTFCREAVATAVAAVLRPCAAAAPEPFRLQYILGSCMYGKMKLGEIVPEV